jgi:hypothetical protein
MRGRLSCGHRKTIQSCLSVYGWSPSWKSDVPRSYFWMQTRLVGVDEGRSGKSKAWNRSGRVSCRSVWLLQFDAARDDHY